MEIVTVVFLNNFSVFRCMENVCKISGNLWKIYGHVWKFMEMYGNTKRSNGICENLWKSMEMY